jgi:phage terminase Nu1 subunit (DNA packaging protein)
MGILSDLLKKAPQSVKDKYKIKIREKAIERTKEKIIKHNKTVEDYSDDEMEAIIAEAESGLNKDVRTGIFK